MDNSPRRKPAVRPLACSADCLYDGFMRTILIPAVRATPQIMDRAQTRGLLRRLVPSEHARRVPPGQQVVERVELAAENTGPWQMLVVACNRSRLTYLAAHSDAESWLFFADPNCKPLFYVVAACPAEEFRAKAADGRLAADDFFTIELRPNDPHTSFFTVPPGVLHDELTHDGPGPAPVFYVPEPSRMDNTRVDLSGYDIRVLPAR